MRVASWIVMANSAPMLQLLDVPLARRCLQDPLATTAAR